MRVNISLTGNVTTKTLHVDYWTNSLETPAWLNPSIFYIPFCEGNILCAGMYLYILFIKIILNELIAKTGIIDSFFKICRTRWNVTYNHKKTRYILSKSRTYSQSIRILKMTSIEYFAAKLILSVGTRL